MVTLFPMAAFADEENPGIPVYGTYSAGNTHWQDLTTVNFGDDTGATAAVNIMVDPSLRFQEYDGLGMSLEETSVSNLWKLRKETREDTLNKLVLDWKIDLFRLVIGCCDCNERHPFWSLDDTPGNKDDFAFEYFSILPDHEQHIVETVKYIQALNPNTKFFASAWSAPAWMKEIRYMDGNNGFVKNEDGTYKVMKNEDGTPMRRYAGWVEWNTYTLPSGAANTRQEQMNYLRDDCIDALAEYYLRYVKAYKDLGVDIYAITILNEPGADVIYPAMNMTTEQHQLLSKAIKKKFKDNGIETQLWAHDWNINDWYSQKSDSGKTINDPTEDNHYKVFTDTAVATAAEMLEVNDAVAVHPYDGGPERLPTQVAPYIGGKKIHQTETNQFGGATLINWFNYGASTYSAWVPFTDRNGGIHYWTGTKTNDYVIPPAGGWTNRIGTTRHDASPDYVTFTNNFYAWGQFSRYLASGSDRPGVNGAVRVFSTTGTQSNVTNVAFMNPNGEVVVVLNNSSSQTRTVKVSLMGKSFVQTLPGSSTSTLRWTPPLPTGEGNKAPVLQAVSDIAMDQYTTKTVQLTGSDPDGDPIVYYGLNLPAGVTVDAKTGLVTLAMNTAGAYTLKFIVSDGIARDEKTVNLAVKLKGVPAGKRVEAELYNDMSGWTVGTNFIENTSVASNGQNIGWTEAGKWLTYYVDIPETGLYDLNFRVCNGNTADSPNCLSLRDASDKTLGTVSVSATGSWTSYVTVSTTAKLFAGEQFVKVYCNAGGFNLDYFELIPKTADAGVPVVMTELTSIVQGYNANIPVIVMGTELGDVNITVQNAETGDVIGSAPVKGAGRFIISVPKVALAGDYVIKATTAAGADSAALKCVPYNPDIWSASVVASGDKLAIRFNAPVTLNMSKLSIKAAHSPDGSALLPLDFGSLSADRLTVITAANYEDYKGIVIISGVKFSELFPSYSFTFTIIRAA